MSVFSVPVTIGVDEEKIAQNIEENVEQMVVNKISTEVKRVIYAKRGWGRTGYDEDDLSPLRAIVKDEVAKVLVDRQDEIIKEAAKALADKLARSKAVKEQAAVIVAENTYGVGV